MNMLITIRSFVIWLVTNFTGSMLAVMLGLQQIALPNKNTDTGTAFLLYFILGSFLSLPALLLTFFNLRYVSVLKRSARVKNIYLAVSIPIFVLLVLFALIVSTSGKYQLVNTYLLLLKMVSAHLLMAIPVTLIFAKDIVESSIHQPDADVIIHEP